MDYSYNYPYELASNFGLFRKYSNSNPSHYNYKSENNNYFLEKKPMNNQKLTRGKPVNDFNNNQFGDKREEDISVTSFETILSKHGVKQILKEKLSTNNSSIKSIFNRKNLFSSFSQTSSFFFSSQTSSSFFFSTTPSTHLATPSFDNFLVEKLIVRQNIKEKHFHFFYLSQSKVFFVIFVFFITPIFICFLVLLGLKIKKSEKCKLIGQKSRNRRYTLVDVIGASLSSACQSRSDSHQKAVKKKNGPILSNKNVVKDSKNKKIDGELMRKKSGLIRGVWRSIKFGRGKVRLENIKLTEKNELINIKNVVNYDEEEEEKNEKKEFSAEVAVSDGFSKKKEFTSEA